MSLLVQVPSLNQLVNTEEPLLTQKEFQLLDRKLSLYKTRSNYGASLKGERVTAYVLQKLEIKPLSTIAVANYQQDMVTAIKRRYIDRMPYKLSRIAEGDVRWVLTGLDEYAGELPEKALKLVNRINHFLEKYNNIEARFYVSDVALISDVSRSTTRYSYDDHRLLRYGQLIKDPFLVVETHKHGEQFADEEFYLTAWDEPLFESKTIR